MQQTASKRRRASTKSIRIRAFALASIFFFAYVPMAHAQATTHWQLVFRYTQNSLSLEKVSEISPTIKNPRTPGLAGAATTLDFEAHWSDASRGEVWQGDIVIPVGYKGFPDENGVCEDFVPESGVIIVRTTGPSPDRLPASIQLTPVAVPGRSPDPTLPVPPVFFQAQDLALPPLDVAATRAAPPPGPNAVTKILNNGSDSNRLVMVIVGDGYTAADLAAGDFNTDAANLVSAFTTVAPWDVYFDYTNVYQLDIESNESGADYEDGEFGTLKDTYLNSQFWTSGIERLLTITGTGYSRAYNAADTWVGPGVWDYIFVLVNSTKYGGAGGSISVSSVHSSSSAVILHEFAHTFAGLADEYTSAYPGYPAGDPEPNVDFDFVLQDLKWNIWVDEGIPLPTPDTLAYEDVVGAFEGARYLEAGIYRPWRRCAMRSNGVPFCPVCKETHVLSFFDVVSLTDSVTPASGTSPSLPLTGTTFSVTPLGLSGLTYDWRLNNVSIPGATSDTLSVVPASLTDLQGPDTLSLTVSHPTSLVRQEPVSEFYSWTLTSSAFPIAEAWVKTTFNGAEHGSFTNPFSALDTALQAVESGGTIVFRSDSNVLNQARTINQQVTLSSRDTQ